MPRGNVTLHLFLPFPINPKLKPLLGPSTLFYPMPLPRACLSHAVACCNAPRPAASPEEDAMPADEPTLPPHSSSSYDIPSTTTTVGSGGGGGASSPGDDVASLLTFPSLPSLIVPYTSMSSTSSPPPTASHHLLASLYHTSPAALAVSPDLLLLYSASESEIAVHSLSDLRRLETLPSPCPSSGAVKSVAASPDGHRLFTAHQDRRIRVWIRSRSKSDQHRLVATLPTATDRLRRFPLPGNYVTVRRHHHRLWIEHADAVSALAAGTSTGLLYSVSWDKSLKVWNTSNLRCLESVSAHDDAVSAVAVATDGTVYTASADRRIRVWARGDRGRHARVATLERHQSAVNALALNEDGSVLYSGACDRSILVWEREESANHMVVAGVLRGHERAVLSLACAGEMVFSGSSDRTVRIWRRGKDGSRYTCLGVMDGHVRGVRSLVAVRVKNADADQEVEEYRVCSGSLDGEVRVWRVRVCLPKESDS